MIANYHTHTYRCNHATDKPRDYVEQALKNGLKILGFSDHNPCPFGNGYKSSHRMDVEETADYVEEIAGLRKEYEGKIRIYTGYETEYYPKEFENILKNIRKYDCDYMILGQHFLDNEYDGVPSGAECDEDGLIKYVDQVIEALKTDVFSYVAHPDVINYRKDELIYKREMTKLCEFAMLNKIPLEFNLLGFREKRKYPYEKFWEIVSKVGNDVIIGCDAHNAIYTGDEKTYNEALQYLSKYDIKPIDKLKFKKV